MTHGIYTFSTDYFDKEEVMGYTQRECEILEKHSGKVAFISIDELLSNDMAFTKSHISVGGYDFRFDQDWDFIFRVF